MLEKILDKCCVTLSKLLNVSEFNNTILVGLVGGSVLLVKTYV